MKKTVIAVLCIAVFVSALSIADEMRGDGLTISTSAPEKYIVKKGDTLWGISENFFNDPWKWPSIWEKNEFIADPHWIYPGQILIFKPVPPPPPEPAPVVEKAPEPEPEPLVVEAPVVETVIETAPEPVVAEDPNLLKKLDTPRPVFSTSSFMRTGYIAQRANIPKTKVTGIVSGSSANKYDKVLIDNRSSDNFKDGEFLAIMSVGDRVKHPVTGNDLGHVLRVKAVAKVLSVGKDVECEIVECYDPVSKNDLVTRAHIRESPDFDAWLKPERPINAIVLARENSLLSVHQSDILYIDSGMNRGIRPGDRFTVISSDSGDAVGEIVAINVMERETAVLVVSLKDSILKIGDKASLYARVRVVDSTK